MRRFLLIFFLAVPLLTFAQEPVATPEIESSFSMVLQDILETLVEQDAYVDIEAMEEQLMELHAHPINLNAAMARELEQLPFLSLDQVDAILLYRDHYAFKSLSDLQLIYSLKDYEIRNLLPFVYVGPAVKQDDRTIADLFRSSHHEINLRLDARNMETYAGDPMYASVKYKMNAGNKILFGAAFQRNPGELPSAHSRYGAYLQLNDIWRFRTIVAGDYRASFGLGLVMNMSQSFGKSSYASQLGMAPQGLHKYNGTSQNFMRGVGATIALGDVDITAFYSYRQPDSISRQMAGVNVAYVHNRLRLGATAVEYWTPQPVPVRNNYYNLNYFRGARQASFSANAQYSYKLLTLLGEVAASQNTQWGWAALLGMRYTPVQDVSLLLLLRHYSITFDPVAASTFSETSRPNDEQGIYLGAEIKRLRYWRFSTYGDFFRFSAPKYMIRTSPSWGLDTYVQADYDRSNRLFMSMRARAKHKGMVDKCSFRYQLRNAVGPVSFHTQLDMNIAYQWSDDTHPDAMLTFGGLLSEQLEYKPSRVPIVAQLRLEGFYAPHWNNRLYAYENDVLYAYSIPMVYGIGMRYYANLRYHINDHFALYIKLSDTWYAKQWAADRSMAAHVTDLHFMLRIMY